ncbi:hypothetical protein L0F63_005367 [Massospora cicadina]|nr:hypothetical protein L0F63_005367 [Massospora cicadina]
MTRRSLRSNADKFISKRDHPVRTTRNTANLRVQANPNPTPNARPVPRIKLRVNEDSYKVLKRLVSSDTKCPKPTKPTDRLFGLEEVPTFYPTEEQFLYPDIYISSLRQYAEHYGMCKIVPPASFRPRFAIDLKGFRFKTEVQKLNHLGAKARAGNNFIEKLRILQEQNGQTFKPPTFYSKMVDLYRLKVLTHDFGGYATVGRDKKWAQVGRKLGYNPTECTSLSFGLRTIYETHILPYEMYIAHAGELKDAASGACAVCQLDTHRQPLLECEQCGRTLHGHCLKPPIKHDYGASFYCYACLRDYEPTFGFDLGSEYSLSEFLNKAYRFKREYVDEHAGLHKKQFSFDDATTSEFEEHWIERKFWEQVGSAMRELSVEYASDLQTSHYGSGFFTLETDPNDPMATHPWNLNNLAANPSNLLAFLNDRESGMTVPWIYIGMLFSAFCWRTEDHFTYSVNYQHWGSPKTYYCTPASHAEQFEDAFKQLAPGLFEQDPDLLYQLVTMLSPADLREAGVPVYAATQRPGDFIITFPRAFYCGFNHGFNFSEAVNYAPADWLSYGQECILQYKALHRAPVFSHDELLLHVATVAHTMIEAVQLHPPLLDMVNREERARATVGKHTKHTLNRPFSSARPADIPQCFICNTYCFLSAVACPCLGDKVACVTHMKVMCHCVLFKRQLLVHVPSETLATLVSNMASLTQPLVVWRKRYLDQVSIHRRPKLEDMESLLNEASKLQCLVPEAVTLEHHVKLCRAWVERANCALSSLQISASSASRRNDQCATIQQLISECASLSFCSPEMATLRQLRKDLKAFAGGMDEIAGAAIPSPSKVLSVAELAAKLNVEPPEQHRLKRLASSLEWAESAEKQLMSDASQSTVCRLLEESRAYALPPAHPMLLKLKGFHKLPASEPAVSNQKDIEHWLHLCQHVIFSNHSGKPQTLLARLEEVNATTNALLKKDTLEVCLCNTRAVSKNLVCSDCGVSYHKACLKPRKSAVIANPYVCPICDPTFRGPIQRKRPNLVGLQLLLSNSPALAGNVPEYALLSELVDALSRLRLDTISAMGTDKYRDRVCLKGVVRLFQALDINLPDELKDLIKMLHPHSIYHKRNSNTAELPNGSDSSVKEKVRRKHKPTECSAPIPSPLVSSPHRSNPMPAVPPPASPHLSSPAPQTLPIIETPEPSLRASSQLKEPSALFSISSLVGRPLSPRMQTVPTCQKPPITIRASCPIIYNDDSD